MTHRLCEAIAYFIFQTLIVSPSRKSCFSFIGFISSYPLCLHGIFFYSLLSLVNLNWCCWLQSYFIWFKYFFGEFEMWIKTYHYVNQHSLFVNKRLVKKTFIGCNFCTSLSHTISNIRQSKSDSGPQQKTFKKLSNYIHTITYRICITSLQRGINLHVSDTTAGTLENCSLWIDMHESMTKTNMTPL